jgi:hypothetical protein
LFLDRSIRTDPESCATPSKFGGAQGRETLTETFRGGDDEGLKMIQRLGARDDRAVACGQQHPHSFSISARSRFDLAVPAQDLASRADRVDRIGLGALTARRTNRSFDLDDPLTGRDEQRGKPRAVAADAFDTPHPHTLGYADAGDRRAIAGLVRGELE